MATVSEPDSDSNQSGSTDGQIEYLGSQEVQRSQQFPHRVSSELSHTQPQWRTSSRLESNMSTEAQTQHSLMEDSLPTPDDLRRQNIMAMDRKRRLTGSAQDTGRRRQLPNNMFDQNYEYAGQPNMGAVSSPTTLHTDGRNSNQFLSSSEVVDLTSSPIASNQSLVSSHNPSQQMSASNTRFYNLPRWQPDSEAAECPICKRPFGLLFRRHHCRKCGRVVCNDCSPHRITIPRQYIVSPPGVDLSISSARSTNVDLTLDNEDSIEDSFSPRSSHISHRRAYRNPVVGGGEKVRLCNPCVPDPQPELQHDFTSTTLPLPSNFARRSDSTLAGMAGGRLPFPLPSPPVPGSGRELIEPFPGMPHPNYMPPYMQQPRSRTQRNHASTFDSFGLPPSTLISGAGSSHRTERHQHRNRASADNFFPVHSRYHSFDPNRASMHSLPRPRIRSLIDEPGRPQRVHSNHIHTPRQQISEEDICPVCRRALPTKGPNGDETARERHIMDCIESRDSSAQASQSRSPGRSGTPPRGPMHMLTFVANEKDCVGEDGVPLECSICMVEYDVGEQLARLECLCKFHRECIVSWFGRKQECPVHKIA